MYVVAKKDCLIASIIIIIMRQINIAVPFKLIMLEKKQKNIVCTMHTAKNEEKKQQQID